MTNKEILAELKKSYEYMQDIRNNGCVDHCNGQLEQKDIQKLNIIMENIAEIYSDLREKTDDSECMITLKDNGTYYNYYIGNCVSEDYSELYDNDNNYTYWVTCEDLGYYWYEDNKFLIS